MLDGGFSAFTHANCCCLRHGNLNLRDTYATLIYATLVCATLPCAKLPGFLCVILSSAGGTLGCAPCYGRMAGSFSLADIFNTNANLAAWTGLDAFHYY